MPQLFKKSEQISVRSLSTSTTAKLIARASDRQLQEQRAHFTSQEDKLRLFESSEKSFLRSLALSPSHHAITETSSILRRS